MQGKNEPDKRNNPLPQAAGLNGTTTPDSVIPDSAANLLNCSQKGAILL